MTYWLLFQLCAFSDPGINGGVQWECYPECLFVISTQCHCVSASRLPSQINFEDADCFVIHTPCQVQIACCVLWLENQRWRKTQNESLSYLKKHFNTSNCKRKGERRGRGWWGWKEGGVTRRRKSEMRLLKWHSRRKTTFQDTSQRNVWGRISDFEVLKFTVKIQTSAALITLRVTSLKKIIIKKCPKICLFNDAMLEIISRLTLAS